MNRDAVPLAVGVTIYVGAPYGLSHKHISLPLVLTRVQAFPAGTMHIHDPAKALRDFCAYPSLSGSRT